ITVLLYTLILYSTITNTACCVLLYVYDDYSYEIHSNRYDCFIVNLIRRTVVITFVRMRYLLNHLKVLYVIYRFMNICFAFVHRVRLHLNSVNLFAFNDFLSRCDEVASDHILEIIVRVNRDKFVVWTPYPTQLSSVRIIYDFTRNPIGN